MALPSSSSISISAIHTELGSTSYSLHALSTSASFSAPDAMREFWGYYKNYVIKYGLAPTAFDGARNSIKLANGGVGVVNATWLKSSGVQTTSKAVILLDGNLNYDFTWNGNDTGAGNSGTPYTTAQMPDGKIVVGGNVDSFNGTSSQKIYRINTNGTIDSGFTAGGKLNGTVTDMVPLPDGKLVVIGGFSTYNTSTSAPGICRLNTDGTFDSAFNGVGSGFNGTPHSIVRLSTGEFIVAGDFSQYNGQSVGRIVKLSSTGTIDSTFQTNSGTGLGGGSYGGSTRVKLAYDDKVYVTGWFTSYNGTSRNLPPRINTNGTLDTTFVNYTGYDLNSYGSVQIEPLPNGKVLYGGLDASLTYGNWKTSLINEDGSLNINLSTQDLALMVAKSNTEFVMLGLSSWKGTSVPGIAVVNTAGTLISTYANYP